MFQRVMPFEAKSFMVTQLKQSHLKHFSTTVQPCSRKSRLESFYVIEESVLKAKQRTAILSVNPSQSLGVKTVKICTGMLLSDKKAVF